jgi:hypothetical protein
MATTLDFSQTYDAQPSAVRAMITDADFITQRAMRTGSTTVDSEVIDEAGGGTTVIVTRTMPANVPSYAKSFVGETLTVTERQEWTVPEADGTGTAVATAELSAPIAFTGSMSITSDGSVTTVRTFGEYKASIPFVGGKVEEMAMEQTLRYLAKEQEIGRDWLTGER